MNVPRSNALVFFVATGNLVYKKIILALYAMERRGRRQAPVIGVARSDWTIEQFRARARKSVEKHDGFDEAVFAKLQERLHYISGDYGAPASHAALCKELGEQLIGDPTELKVVHHPHGDEMDAYERLLNDAIVGDGTLFAVRTAWRPRGRSFNPSWVW